MPAELSDELLQQPVMQALMAGSPPAASTQLASAAESPIGKLVVQNVDALRQAGFGFYRSQDGALGVMFNQLKINPQEIVQADQQGNLLQIAPPIEQVEQAIAADPSANPVLSAQGPSPEGGAAPPPIPGGTATPPAPGGGGGLESRLFTARKNAAAGPGSPTEGPKPGAGRLTNAIMSPVV